MGTGRGGGGSGGRGGHLYDNENKGGGGGHEKREWDRVNIKRTNSTPSSSIFKDYF